MHRECTILVGLFLHNTGVRLTVDNLIELVAYYNHLSAHPLSKAEIRAVPSFIIANMILFAQKAFAGSGKFGIKNLEANHDFFKEIQKLMEDTDELFEYFLDEESYGAFFLEVKVREFQLQIDAFTWIESKELDRAL